MLAAEIGEVKCVKVFSKYGPATGSINSYRSVLDTCTARKHDSAYLWCKNGADQSKQVKVMTLYTKNIRLVAGPLTAAAW